MDSRFIVYGLVDPRDGQLRYVGRSSYGMRRPLQHGQAWYLAKHPDWHVTRWVSQLQALGLSYDVRVLENHERAEDLVEAERRCIAHFRSLGCRLTNLTDGGEGTVGFKHAPQSILLMSAARRGKGRGVRSVATRMKMSESRKRLLATPEMKAKLAAPRKPLSAAHRQKISEARRRFMEANRAAQC